MINIKFRIKESDSIDNQIKSINDELGNMFNIIHNIEVYKKHMPSCSFYYQNDGFHITSKSKELYKKVNEITGNPSNEDSIHINFNYNFIENNNNYTITSKSYYITSLWGNHVINLDELHKLCLLLKNNNNFKQEDVIKYICKKYLTHCSNLNIMPKIKFVRNEKYKISEQTENKYKEYFQKFINVY